MAWKTAEQDAAEWAERQPKPDPKRLSSGVIEREALPHRSLEVGVVSHPGPYSYEMLLIGRRRGEGMSDVALVLDAYERIAIYSALKSSNDRIVEETGKKGVIWEMLEGLYEVNQDLMDRLEHVKDFVEGTRKDDL